MFFLLAPARARFSRSPRSLVLLSPRGVPTTQIDKSNPENGTGDAASSGKKVGPELTAENASRGGTPIQITG